MVKKLALMACSVLCVLFLASCSGPQASSVAGAFADGTGDSESSTVYIPGSLEDGAYTNRYFNIRWNLPSGWSFVDDAAIDKYNEAIGDFSDNEAAKEALESGSAYIDMMAIAADGVNNVTVAIRSASVIANTIVEDEELLKNATQAELELLEEEGRTDVKLEEQKSGFCGARVPSTLITYQINDIPVYERLIVKQFGSYYLEIAVTTADRDTTSELLAQFQPYVSSSTSK